MLFPCVTFVPPTLTRLCNSSNTQVPRFLSSPSLLLRSSINFLPTLAVATTGRVSSFHDYICQCSSYASQSESKQEMTSPCAIDAAIDSAVVKIFSFPSKSDFYGRPWESQPWLESRGSGFVISGRRILTNTHVVENHTYVQVRKHGSPTRYKAKVETVGHDCDLAILVTDNDEFWEGMNPLELGEDVPFIGDSISVFCYPWDSGNISVTKCIVQKVEPREYCHSSTDLLAIQIIKPETTEDIDGGMVVMGNKVVGSYYEDPWYYKDSWRGRNYIIPTPVIKHFLNCVEENGRYTGFASLDISCQPMENDQIRKHFKMSHEMTGILINGIHPLSDAHKILKKHDVILAIDGVHIGNDETVSFRENERIHFNHLVSMKKPGETCLFRVLRNGREHEFNISLNSVPPLLPTQHDLSYYILAGFVFIPLSKPYISFDNCQCQLKRKAKKAGDQIVIISKVFLSDISTGYTRLSNRQVKKVNGVEVVNLKHLSELIEKCCTEELRLDFEDEMVIFLNNKSAKEETSLILERHGIPSAMSKNLREN